MVIIVINKTYLFTSAFQVLDLFSSITTYVKLTQLFGPVGVFYSK